MKRRIATLALSLLLLLSMATVGLAVETSDGAAGLSVTADDQGGRTVVTVGLSDGADVSNGRVVMHYNPQLVTLAKAQAADGMGMTSINLNDTGEISLAWVGSSLSQGDALVTLTFRPVLGHGEDMPYTAEALELYAGSEKLTAGGDSALVAANPFGDIDRCWAKQEILDAYHSGWFKGTSDTAFSPEGTMDRGMFVTVLYRLAGSPAVEDIDIGFDDVPADEYFAAPLPGL